MRVDRTKILNRRGCDQIECYLLAKRLSECSDDDLIVQLSEIKVWNYGKCELGLWADVLDRLDAILERAVSRVGGWMLNLDTPENSNMVKDVVTILEFTGHLVEHSIYRYLYNSWNHIMALFGSQNMDVLLAVLGLAYNFSKRSNYFSRLDSSNKRLIMERLLSIAETWGGTENNFGLSACCDPDHFPETAGNIFFEYRREPLPSNTSCGNTASGDESCLATNNPATQKIILSAVHLRNRSPAIIMEDILSDHHIPESKQMALFARIRLAVYFVNPEQRYKCIRARLQALSILCYTFEVDQQILYPNLIDELMELLQLPDDQHTIIKACGLRTMTAIVNSNRLSINWSSLVASTGLSSHRGVLPDLVRRWMKGLVDGSIQAYGGTPNQQFTTALLSFLYHLACYEENAGSNIVQTPTLYSSGVLQSMLQLINWHTTPLDYLSYVTRAVRVTDQILMSSPNNRGLVIGNLIERLSSEVDLALQESSRIVQTPDTPPHLNTQRSGLIKAIINLLKRLCLDTDWAELMHPMMDSTLPDILSRIFINGAIFSPNLALVSIETITNYLYTYPSRLSSLQDKNVTTHILNALATQPLPQSRDFLVQIPGILNTLGLNARGVEAVKSSNILEHYLKTLVSPRYLVTMKTKRVRDYLTRMVHTLDTSVAHTMPTNLTATQMGSAVQELIRSHAELKPTIFTNLLTCFQQLIDLGNTHPAPLLTKSLQASCLLPSKSVTNPPTLIQSSSNVPTRSTSQISGHTAPNTGPRGTGSRMGTVDFRSDDDVVMLSGDEDEDDGNEMECFNQSSSTIPQPLLDEDRPSTPRDTILTIYSSIIHPSNNTPLPTHILVADFMLNMCKFLEKLLPSAIHVTEAMCRQFVSLNGLQILRNLLCMPGLPYDFPVSAACASLCKIYEELANTVNLEDVVEPLLKILEQSLQNLTALTTREFHVHSILLHEYATSKNLMLHELVVTASVLCILVQILDHLKAELCVPFLFIWLRHDVMQMLGKLYLSVSWEAGIILKLIFNDERITYADLDLSDPMDCAQSTSHSVLNREQSKIVVPQFVEALHLYSVLKFTGSLDNHGSGTFMYDRPDLYEAAHAILHVCAYIINSVTELCVSWSRFFSSRHTNNHRRRRINTNFDQFPASAKFSALCQLMHVLVDLLAWETPPLSLHLLSPTLTYSMHYVSLRLTNALLNDNGQNMSQIEMLNAFHKIGGVQMYFGLFTTFTPPKSTDITTSGLFSKMLCEWLLCAKRISDFERIHKTIKQSATPERCPLEFSKYIDSVNACLLYPLEQLCTREELRHKLNRDGIENFVTLLITAAPKLFGPMQTPHDACAPSVQPGTSQQSTPTKMGELITSLRSHVLEACCSMAKRNRSVQVLYKISELILCSGEEERYINELYGFVAKSVNKSLNALPQSPTHLHDASSHSMSVENSVVGLHLSVLLFLRCQDLCTRLAWQHNLPDLLVTWISHFDNLLTERVAMDRLAVLEFYDTLLLSTLFLDQYERSIKVIQLRERSEQIHSNSHSWKFFDERAKNWQPIPLDVQNEIDTAFRQGHLDIACSMSGRSCTVDFTSMTQLHRDIINRPILLFPNAEDDVVENTVPTNQEVTCCTSPPSLSQTQRECLLRSLIGQLKLSTSYRIRQLPILPAECIEAVLRLVLRLVFTNYHDARLLIETDFLSILFSLPHSASFHSDYTVLVGALLIQAFDDVSTVTRAMRQIFKWLCYYGVPPGFPGISAVPNTCMDMFCLMNSAVPLFAKDQDVACHLVKEGVEFVNDSADKNESCARQYSVSNYKSTESIDEKPWLSAQQLKIVNDLINLVIHSAPTDDKSLNEVSKEIGSDSDSSPRAAAELSSSISSTDSSEKNRDPRSILLLGRAEAICYLTELIGSCDLVAEYIISYNYVSTKTPDSVDSVPFLLLLFMECLTDSKVGNSTYSLLHHLFIVGRPKSQNLIIRTYRDSLYRLFNSISPLTPCPSKPATEFSINDYLAAHLSFLEGLLSLPSPYLERTYRLVLRHRLASLLAKSITIIDCNSASTISTFTVLLRTLKKLFHSNHPSPHLRDLSSRRVLHRTTPTGVNISSSNHESDPSAHGDRQSQSPNTYASTPAASAESTLPMETYRRHAGTPIPSEEDEEEEDEADGGTDANMQSYRAIYSQDISDEAGELPTSSTVLHLPSEDFFLSDRFANPSLNQTWNTLTYDQDDDDDDDGDEEDEEIGTRQLTNFSYDHTEDGNIDLSDTSSSDADSSHTVTSPGQDDLPATDVVVTNEHGVSTNRRQLNSSNDTGNLQSPQFRLYRPSRSLHDGFNDAGDDEDDEDEDDDDDEVYEDEGSLDNVPGGVRSDRQSSRIQLFDVLEENFRRSIASSNHRHRHHHHHSTTVNRYGGSFALMPDNTDWNLTASIRMNELFRRNADIQRGHELRRPQIGNTTYRLGSSSSSHTPIMIHERDCPHFTITRRSPWTTSTQTSGFQQNRQLHDLASLHPLLQVRTHSPEAYNFTAIHPDAPSLNNAHTGRTVFSMSQTPIHTNPDPSTSTNQLFPNWMPPAFLPHCRQTINFNTQSPDLFSISDIPSLSVTNVLSGRQQTSNSDAATTVRPPHTPRSGPRADARMWTFLNNLTTAQGPCSTLTLVDTLFSKLDKLDEDQNNLPYFLISSTSHVPRGLLLPISYRRWLTLTRLLFGHELMDLMIIVRSTVYRQLLDKHKAKCKSLGIDDNVQSNAQSIVSNIAPEQSQIDILDLSTRTPVMCDTPPATPITSLQASLVSSIACPATDFVTATTTSSVIPITAATSFTSTTVTNPSTVTTSNVDVPMSDEDVVHSLIAGGMDPSFLDALPEDMRREILLDHRHARQMQQQLSSLTLPEPINSEWLAALPTSIQDEVLTQFRIEQQSAQNPTVTTNDAVATRSTTNTTTTATVSAPVPRENNTAFLQGLPASLLREVLTDLDESQLDTLPADLAAEARQLRQLRLTRLHATTVPSASRLRDDHDFWSAAAVTSGFPITSSIPFPSVHRVLHQATLNAAMMPSTESTSIYGGKQCVNSEGLVCLLVLLIASSTCLQHNRQLVTTLRKVLTNLSSNYSTRKWIIGALLCLCSELSECTNHANDFTAPSDPVTATTTIHDTCVSQTFNNTHTLTNNLIFDTGLEVALGCWVRTFLPVSLPLPDTNKMSGENATPSQRRFRVHPRAAVGVAGILLETLEEFVKLFPTYFYPRLSNQAKDVIPVDFMNREWPKPPFWDVFEGLTDSVYSGESPLSVDDPRVQSNQRYRLPGPSVSVTASASKPVPSQQPWTSSSTSTRNPFIELASYLFHPIIQNHSHLMERVLSLLATAIKNYLVSLKSNDEQSSTALLKTQSEQSTNQLDVENLPENAIDPIPVQSDNSGNLFPSELIAKLCELVWSPTSTTETVLTAAQLLTDIAHADPKTKPVIVQLVLQFAFDLASKLFDQLEALINQLDTMSVASMEFQLSMYPIPAVERPSSSAETNTVRDRFNDNTDVVISSESSLITSALLDQHLKAAHPFSTANSIQARFRSLVGLVVRLVNGQNSINANERISIVTENPFHAHTVLSNVWTQLCISFEKLHALPIPGASGLLQPLLESFCLAHLHLVRDFFCLRQQTFHSTRSNNSSTSMIGVLDAVPTLHLLSESLLESKIEHPVDQAPVHQSTSHVHLEVMGPLSPPSPACEEEKLTTVIPQTSSLRQSNALTSFAEQHRQALNQMLRLRTNTAIDSPLTVFLAYPRMLDFDIKRRCFRAHLRALSHQSVLINRFTDEPITISRNRIFEDSYGRLHRKVAADWKRKFVIRFQNEEGQDAGGPLREWYLLMSREIFNPNYCLFRTSPADRITYTINPSSYINSNHLSYFTFVGRFIAKAIFDNKLLECYFSRAFYKHILGVPLKYSDLESEDYDFYQGLEFLLNNPVSSLGYDLTFSTEINEFGRMETRDLVENGRIIQVTEQNKREYVRLVCQERMTGAIRQQLDAFLTGFYEIIPKRMISIFNEQELELLISGLPNFDIEDLKANTTYSKYQLDSPQIEWFWQSLESFSTEDRARFLQFVTGTSKVPLGGFAHLEGMHGPTKFQISRASVSSTDYLPCAHTCFNTLVLPAYETYEQLHSRLLTAITECSEGYGMA